MDRDDRKTLIGFLNVLIDEGVPLEIFRRDVEIRHKFFTSIADNPKINRTELKTQLADQYNIGYKSVEAIIYGTKTKVKNDEDSLERSDREI